MAVNRGDPELVGSNDFPTFALLVRWSNDPYIDENGDTVPPERWVLEDHDDPDPLDAFRFGAVFGSRLAARVAEGAAPPTAEALNIEMRVAFAKWLADSRVAASPGGGTDG